MDAIYDGLRKSDMPLGLDVGKDIVERGVLVMYRRPRVALDIVSL